jgi:(S)-1-phenylethanol dehydrogenase
MAASHHDKIAVISGGANGIGQAFAQRLAQDGAHIVVADIAAANETVKMVEQAGRQALACTCDVSSEGSVKGLAGEVAKRFGRCDILINCAGVFPLQPFEQMTFADWRRVQAINLDSVFLTSPLPCRRSSGRKYRPTWWGRCRS